MSQELSKVEIIVDPNYPNKGWVTKEAIQDQARTVKEFLEFMKHHPTQTEPTIFTILFLGPSNARNLENFFKVYRDSLSLPIWLQIKVD